MVSGQRRAKEAQTPFPQSLTLILSKSNDDIAMAL